MGYFDAVSTAPPDPILGLGAAFLADPREHKVNLGIGVYRDANLITPIMRAVKRAEEQLVLQERTKEYLPSEGDQAFTQHMGRLIFGEALWKSHAERICGAQAVAGSGALRVCGDLLRHELTDAIYIPDPTWPNHRALFTRVGMAVHTYPYYDVSKNVLMFDRLLEVLSQLPERSLVLLHGCCHNPTGADLQLQQWRVLSTLFLKHHLIPFFDSAYQGFAQGMEEDAAPMRLFLEEGHEMLVAHSCSKNFSLYAERVGALFFVSHSPKVAARIESKVRTFVRTNYSNPPVHGARIIRTILESAPLKELWEQELAAMRERISEMRRAFASALGSRISTRDFSYLLDRTGLFSFCGLTKAQVDRLLAEFGIYMTGDGRVNLAGLSAENFEYVVDAIAAVECT